jgi:hypothetical protein
MMADPRSDAVSRARNRHVHRLQSGIVSRRETPVSGQASDRSVGKVARNQIAESIDLSLRGSVPLHILAIQ